VKSYSTPPGYSSLFVNTDATAAGLRKGAHGLLSSSFEPSKREWGGGALLWALLKIPSAALLRRSKVLTEKHEKLRGKVA